MALVSVVAPMHDEVGTVEAFHGRVAAALEGERWELVVVDDGSRDGTGEALARLAAAYERVRVVALSRRFGHQAALTAGLEHARGDAVVMMDGDLQDPPDVVPTMLERCRFLRGMTEWVGFTQTAVPFVRETRSAGRTKYTFARMLRFSFDAITSFSNRPLQLATVLGFTFSLLAFLCIPLTIVARYANIYTRGVPTTIVVVLLLGGIQLITVGIIGEYVGRIYDEVKHRPLYVVRERINVEAPEERAEAADRS